MKGGFRGPGKPVIPMARRCREHEFQAQPFLNGRGNLAKCRKCGVLQRAIQRRHR